MNLKRWAEQRGVSYAAARRWFGAGLLPVPARRVGRLIVVSDRQNAQPVSGVTAVYARVWSADQEPVLGRQVAGVAARAAGEGLAVGRVVAGVDGGLVRGVTGILASLCARLCGRRAAADRAAEAVSAVTGGTR